MLPRLGMPLESWALNATDFDCMHTPTNGLNLSVLASTWFGLLQDSPVDDGKTFRQAVRFYNRLAGDLRTLTREYAELGDELDRSVTHTDLGTVKKPMFRQFARTPIFREYHNWFLTGNPKVFQYIKSFLWFGKKAEYNDPTLEQQALISWKQVEQELAELQLPQHVLKDLRKVLEFQGLRVRWDEDLVFKHGPGSVAERDVHTTIDKNMTVAYHASLAKLVDSLPATPYADLVLPDPFRWDSTKYGLSGTTSSAVSWLQFVRKDYKSVRTICKEPTTFMWAQQALMNALVRAIARSSLSSVVDIQSQDKNRNQAQLASEGGTFSTLDLKGASDRVSKKLIEALFSGKLLDMLMATRTSLVQLPADEWGNEDVVLVNKFAPMGSAVCFPIQSIVFALIAILCNHLHVHGIDIREYLESGIPRIKHYVVPPVEGTCVYGDDIIIPDNQTQGMIHLLTALGFVVNTSKSFYGDAAVRESCGIFALDGADVTPILFKVKGIMEDTHDSVLGRIALCNALFKLGYHRARDAVMRSLAPRYYVVVDPESCYSTQGCAIHGYEGNPGRKARWNKHLCRLEIKITRPRFTEDHEVGSKMGDNDNPITVNRRDRDKRTNAESRYRLSLWLARPFTVEGGSHTIPIDTDRVSKWGWRWTPVS